MILSKVWRELLHSCYHRSFIGFLDDNGVIHFCDHHNNEVSVGEEVELVEGMLRNVDLG